MELKEGEIPSYSLGEDVSAMMSSLAPTPITDNQQRPVNASTISQSTPLTPTSLVFTDADINDFVERSPPRSGEKRGLSPSHTPSPKAKRRSKQASKSGSGKRALDLLPQSQAFSQKKPATARKPPAKPRQSRKKASAELAELDRLQEENHGGCRGIEGADRCRKVFREQ